MAKNQVAERQKTVQSLLPMRNGMTDRNREAVIDLLNQQVADHYVLVTKTKFYHWNVEGPEFHDIHLLLDEHYETLSDIVDLLAEQCLKLGGQAAEHWPGSRHTHDSRKTRASRSRIRAA